MTGTCSIHGCNRPRSYSFMCEHHSVFVFDEYACQHLHEWFRAGSAPNDWRLSDLVSFEAWMHANADRFTFDTGWPVMARQFDLDRCGGRP